MNIKVSILMPSFRRPHLLEWGLSSLTKQSIPFDMEVLVMNDGLEDGTEEVCSKFRSKCDIKYFFTGQRNLKEIRWRVPGFAVNIGAREATGNIFVICDAEMFHLNNTIEKLVQPLLTDAKLLTTPYGKDDAGGTFLNNLIKTNGQIDYHLFSGCHDLNTSIPFLMGMHRQEFYTIGGYDEDFTGFGFDDNDLVDRLILNGCKYHKTDAKAIHLYHPRRGPAGVNTPQWKHNNKLYANRRGILVRNQGREWGKR